jgi:hypothetical protein
MKSWQLVLIVGAVVLVGAVLIMKTQQPKATPINSSFGAPVGSLIGLASAAIPSIIGAFNKPSGDGGYGNDKTYQTGIVPVISGNTLVDPNTGKTLDYGTGY